MSEEAADAAIGGMQAYAIERDLQYFDHWSLPQATQLLKHGFLQEVRNLCQGDLPGNIEKGWLAHFSYSAIDGTDIEQRFFTVVVAPATESALEAVRVFCHDRSLTELDTSNPQEGLDLVELPDRRLRFESEALLGRYKLWSDHDQDELKAWQLFDPSLIAWLTEDAPAKFSFEIQNGAVSAFVPGVVSEPAALDALCDGAARVRRHVTDLAGEIGGTTPAWPSADPSRDAIADRRIAERPFDKPPKSVKAAARHLGRWGLFPTDASWLLGGEAFFRIHAARHGLTPIDRDAFVAAHLESVLPGEVTQVAEGTLPGSDLRGQLMWSVEADNRDLGWQTVRGQIEEGENGLAYIQLPGFERAQEEAGLETTSDVTSIFIYKAGHPHERTAESLDSFLRSAVPPLVAAYEATKKSLRYKP